MSITARIVKRFSPRFCLDVSFETAACTRLAILGESGCGKSATLKCLAGIETPDEGFISVNGRVLFDSAAKINVMAGKRHCGLLFQQYALFPRMNALENVRAGLCASRLGRPAKNRLARQWLARMELSGFEQRLPAQLSGGQQQRLALARMLAAEPDFVLLDEPFSALDGTMREQMRLQCAEILRDCRDVVLVTHDRDEAYGLCSSILVMDAGRTLVHAGRDEVFANPRTVRAARITGCKNIAAVTRLGACEVYAHAWGLKLRFLQPPDDDITHVGIRARDIQAAPPHSPPGVNLVRPRFISRTGGLFEDVLLFANADAQAGEGGGELWWKTPRAQAATVDTAGFLYFPPERLLALRQ
ncbi:MAG: ATP-binding cassette domain-containing protein [Spirochaetaceae bacterium]|nr:ATP-binding cassette domain-containing protein [Spirochaetaceae bacterium]